HHGTAQNVGRGRERLSFERERSVGVPHDHRHILENEVMLVPTQLGDFFSDLIGSPHVVVSDCPQVPRTLHCRSSRSAQPPSARRWPFDSRTIRQPWIELRDDIGKYSL